MAETNQESENSIQKNQNIPIPNSVKFAAYCFVGHAIIVLFSAGFYIFWSHDASNLIRALIRIFGMLVIAAGLLKREIWVWRIGVVLSAILSLAALISILVIFNPESLSSRPYPILDKITIALSALFIISAFVFLVTSEAREWFKNNSKK